MIAGLGVGKLIRADMMDMIPRNEVQGLLNNEHALSSDIDGAVG